MSSQSASYLLTSACSSVTANARSTAARIVTLRRCPRQSLCFWRCATTTQLSHRAPCLLPCVVVCASSAPVASGSPRLRIARGKAVGRSTGASFLPFETRRGTPGFAASSRGKTIGLCRSSCCGSCTSTKCRACPRSLAAAGSHVPACACRES